MKYATVLVTSSRVLIRSARRNPELNVREDFKQQILRKYGKGKDIYVSFQDMPKLGMNPHGLDGVTPMGVYAFPIEHIFTEDFNYRSKVITGREYVYILKRTSSKMLTIPNNSFNVDKALRKLAYILVTKYKNILQDKNRTVEEVARNLQHMKNNKVLNKNYNINYDSKGSAKFYSLLQNALLYETLEKGVVTRYMNYILRDLGYDIVEDKGTSSIHYMEPYQTIFLTPSSFKVLGSVDNYSKGKEITELHEIFNFREALDNPDYRNIIIDYTCYLMDKPSRTSRYIFNIKGSKKEQLERFMEVFNDRNGFSPSTILQYPSFYRSLAAILYEYDVKMFNTVFTYLTRSELQEYLKDKDLYKEEDSDKLTEYTKKIKEIFKKDVQKDSTLPIPKFRYIDPKDLFSTVDYSYTRLNNKEEIKKRQEQRERVRRSKPLK